MKSVKNVNQRNMNLPPDRWEETARRSELIAEKFLAFKTPLNPQFEVAGENQFTIEMLFALLKAKRINMKLIVDLTNTNRYYQRTKVLRHECKHVKIKCVGKGGPPTPEQTKNFIEVVDTFIRNNPLAVVGVHCTHGYNRTGFMIVSYMVEKMDMDLVLAIEQFKEKRSPGIYKFDYVEALFKKYNCIEDMPPSWVQKRERRGRPLSPVKDPKFATELNAVTAVTDEETRQKLMVNIYDLMNWPRYDFPGAQPVSMSKDNVHLIWTEEYEVSWKADGTRYMCFIKDKDEVYFLDRNCSLFRMSGLQFPHHETLDRHLKDTLLDGELVIDVTNEQKIVRYYIYDIISYDGKVISQLPFSPNRAKTIEKYVVKSRYEAMSKGLINKQIEPISVRKKDFWSVRMLEKVLEPKFFAKQIFHEIDGLIFQPSKKPYECGRCDSILKWKPSELNSIDFRLRITKDQTSKKRCYLYTIKNGVNDLFAEMPYSKTLEKLNDKIVECSLENGVYKVLRERTDKTFPNATDTAINIMETIVNPISKEFLIQMVRQKLNDFKTPVLPLPK